MVSQCACNNKHDVSELYDSSYGDGLHGQNEKADS